MTEKIACDNLQWVHIDKPRRKDWQFLKKEFQLPEDFVLKISEDVQQARIEEWDDSLYLNLAVPTFNRQKQITEASDLHILLKDNLLVTMVFKSNIPVRSIWHHAQKSKKFREELMKDNVVFFLINFLQKLTSLSFDKIKHINENIEWVKDTIFSDDRYDTVEEISKIKLDILTFRRVLKPQKALFETMLREGFSFFNYPVIQAEIRELIRINIKVWNSIESAQEIIESLEVTNNSMVSYRLSNTMRFLASVSLITFAMSVTLGIFSVIPFGGFSLAHEPVSFWLIMLILFLVAFLAYLWLKKKRWL